MSAHPAFTVIVALWFAALLGIGSMVLPLALFERLSEAAGLPAVLGAAQPPLGMTARIVVALGAALVGALTGLAIARGISARNRGPEPVFDETTIIEAEVAAPPAPDIRPISAHVELGEGGFDAEVHARENGMDTTEEAFDANAVDTTPLHAEPETPETRSELHEESEMIERPFAEFETPRRPRESSGEVAIVDLVDRFARALQRHRESLPGDAEYAAMPEGVGDYSAAEAAPDPTQEESAAEDFSPTALSGPQVPAALRSVDFGWEDDAEEDEDASGGSYPSLLAMKSPFGLPREPIRLEDEADREAGDPSGETTEPVAVFPGKQAAVPPATPIARDEAETALREALEKLQRMSGTAA